MKVTKKTYMRKFKDTLLLMLCATLLLFYYGKNVSQITTVWELGDEYGYLANAAYMAGVDWDFFYSSYFGYGYSVLLIPLFKLCNSGVQIIQGAVLINVCCVVVMFFVLVFLMEKLCTELSRTMITVSSFILCLYPYLLASSMKVFSECFLSLLFSLTWLLLYKALRTDKVFYFLWLGVVLPYLYFVHTRAICVVGVVVLAIIILATRNRIGWKKVGFFLLAFVVTFVAGYMLKTHILFEIADDPAVGEGIEKEIKNTIGLDYVLERIRWLFSKDFIFYIYAFMCKNFYLFSASFGLFHLGLYGAFMSVKKEWREKKELSVENTVKIILLTSVAVTIFALLFTGAGMLNQWSYFYYGRYYEFMIFPIVLCGIDFYFANEKPGIHIKAMLLFYIMTFFCIRLAGILTNQSVIIDTNRIVSFTHAVTRTESYREMISYIVCVTGMAVSIMIIFSFYPRLKVLVLVPLCILFLKNDTQVEKTIEEISNKSIGDNEIVEFLKENCEGEEIFFINAEYRYEGYFSKMQVLLGRDKLKVIELDDIDKIPENDYFATYHNGLNTEELLKSNKRIIEGYIFELYQR